MTKTDKKSLLDVSWIDLNDPIGSLRKRLPLYIDPGYDNFVKKSLPKDTCEVYGIRTPPLKQTVNEIVAVDGPAFLNAILFPKKSKNASKRKNAKSLKLDYCEERIVVAFLIGKLKLSFEQRIDAICAFSPYIDSWYVCDTLCGAYKPKPSELFDLWNFLGVWFESQNPYEQRVAIVMTLKYFITAETIGAALDRIEDLAIKGITDHTVSMGTAWLLCEAFIKRPNETFSYLNDNSLDDVTFNHAIQKICESLRVDDETKKEIGAMKRFKKAR